MGFAADLHSARLSLRRAELTEVKDDGDFQRITALGYAGETIKLAHRVQPFGLSSHPPKESHGLAVFVNGRPDQSVFLGLEHPSHRPKSLPVGAVALYNAHGDIIKVFQQMVEIVTVTVKIKATTKIVLEAPRVDLGAEGGVAVALTGGGTATKVFAV